MNFTTGHKETTWLSSRNRELTETTSPPSPPLLEERGTGGEAELKIKKPFVNLQDIINSVVNVLNSIINTFQTKI